MPMLRCWPLLLTAVLCLAPAGATAQREEGRGSRGFVGLWGGAVYDADRTDAGPDFAFGLQAGLQGSLLGFGVELGQQRTGQSDKSDLLGAIVRITAPVGPIRSYAVGGIGVYRFAPSGVFDNSKVGASIGVGLLVNLGVLQRARFGVEARYHSVFNRSPGLSSQRFVTVMAGVQIGQL
jgi:hypothetical protein